MPGLWKVLCLFTLISSAAWALVDGAVSGNLTDPQGVAISSAHVKLFSAQGQLVKETTSSATGDYQFFPVTLGNYTVRVEAPEYAPYSADVYVNAGGSAQADIHLLPKGAGGEMVLRVKAKNIGSKVFVSQRHGHWPGANSTTSPGRRN